MCDQNENIVSGIIIGAVGGFVAGIAVWVAGIFKEEWLKRRDKRRILKFLQAEKKDGFQFRNTWAIASNTNLPEDRVRFICSIEKKIKRNELEREMWQLLN